MTEQIEAVFRIVTPMFIGDADQGPTDGIRPPSVKGALRFWWRALNWGRMRGSSHNDAQALREVHCEEARLFGSAATDSGGGQGSFLLSVQSDSLHFQAKPTQHRKFANHDAARYLGYGLMVAFGGFNRTTQVRTCDGQLSRGCIDEDQEFTVKLMFRDKVDESLRDALIALGLLGGLGSRTRHGLGSIGLKSIRRGNETIWEEPQNIDGYVENLKLLVHGRCNQAGVAPYTAFSSDARVDLLTQGSTPYEILEKFGNAMLHYRSWGKSSRGNQLAGGGVSEFRFKDDHNWSKVGGWRTTHQNFHPERVVFGLPHNYGDQPSQKVAGTDHDRRSTPLFFHVHQVGDSFLGVSTFLPAQFLPDSEKINAGGSSVPQNINWGLVYNFLDGLVGNPPLPGALPRFPSKIKVLP